MNDGFVLDTNVLSNATKREPDLAVEAWLKRQHDHALFIASFTLGELQRGIEMWPGGRKKAEMQAWLTGPTGLLASFAGRVLPFNDGAALYWGRLMAVNAIRGRSRSPLDMIIAATAGANGMTVVTMNEKDFSGCGVAWFNPRTGESGL